MTKPITPFEVAKLKKEQIPPEVFAAFNELIAGNFDGRSAIIKQKDVVRKIVSFLNIGEDVIYARHWLDVEDLYREAGWEVAYDKPAYNETYEATFKFSRK